MLIKDSFEQYKKADAINASALKNYFDGDWLHFDICRKISHLRPEKEAFNFGRACHEFILEQEEFEKNYVVKPEDLKFSTKEGKAWKEKNNCKEILDGSDYEKMQYAKAYWNCHGISAVEDLKTEHSAYIDFSGIKLKSRFDVISEEQNFICDFKTTRDDNIKDFQKSIVDFKYWVQAGFYSVVYEELYAKIPDFYFFCIPKSGNTPFLCKIATTDLVRFMQIVKSLLLEYSLNAESEIPEIEFNKWQREKMEM